DDGATDATSADDAGDDAAIQDAGPVDAGTPDAAPTDAAPTDAEASDAAIGDAAPADAAMAPIIATFTATPAWVPRGGGTVTLSWSVTGADVSSIAPSPGVVTGQSTVQVTVTATTTFTLTAANGSGVATAEVTVRAGGLYVHPTLGDDASPGTTAQPLRTIARAAELGLAGDTIFLFDGVHEIQFVSLRDHTQLVALRSGGATVRLPFATNGSLTLEGSATVRGIDVGSAGAFGFFRASSGTLVLDDVRYTAPSGNYALIAASGTAVVDAFAPPGGEWCPTVCNTAFATVSDSAVVRVHGGRISRFANTYQLFATSGAGALELEDVVVEGGVASTAIVVLGNTGITANTGSARLTRTRIASNQATAVLVGFGSAGLVVEDSEIIDNTGTGVHFYSGGNYSTLTQTATIARSHVDRNERGLYFGLESRARVVVRDSTFDDNVQDGVTAVFTRGSALDMASSTVIGSGQRGFDYSTEANKVSHLRLRDVEITGNAAEGLLLAGLATSTFDLGTDVEPGGNVIRDNGAGALPGIQVNLTAEPVWAVGCVWRALEQGSSAAGLYTPPGSGYVEVVGPVTSGLNHRLTAGARLRL
ncbi:right-handed parallel beta-helix repeat-containing protein, partial [Myxococcota bacterium]|nr:right-handed parallel beta-helix repeat-containing protein [Myxococcota bacterium]